MKYLVFNTVEEALFRSTQEYISRTTNSVGSVTQYWWGVYKHPITNKGALVIPSNDISDLATIEQAALITQTKFEGDGWLPQDTLSS